MYRLYDFLPSGNGYKIRLLLSQLGIPFDYIELNILDGETRTADFLAKNPNGRIPLLELESGIFLSESNAILCFLAEGTTFFLSDIPNIENHQRFERAKILQWLFFEQYSHEPYIATSRFWLEFGMASEKEQALAEKQAPGYAALDVLEQRLTQHPFLVADRYTIADISLYAYTHVAEEGNFSLANYPAIRAWLERVSAQPNHLTITTVPGERQ